MSREELGELNQVTVWGENVPQDQVEALLKWCEDHLKGRWIAHRHEQKGKVDARVSIFRDKYSVDLAKALETLQAMSA